MIYTMEIIYTKFFCAIQYIYI